MKKIFFKKIDYLLFLFILPILLTNLFTMKSFTGTSNSVDFFQKQIVWIFLSLIVFFVFSFIDFRFLKRTDVLVFLFLFFLLLLVFLFLIGANVQGSSRWFDFGGFSFQPVEVMKLVLILILAKYFSRRHVEIKNIKHLFISGLYVLLPFLLVFFQPDFGSAIILFLIWLGMVLVSGISKKHLFFVFLIILMSSMVLWLFVFAPYQKNRIINFFNPLADPYGSGYNALQSTIAVGSGQFLGKGLGFGSQSRLSFLPEAETDFIFAAFAEE